MSINVQQVYESIIVTIDGVLHLHIHKPHLQAVQSYMDDDHGPLRWFVEFTMVGGGEVTTEYDTEEKWLAVLDGLKAVLN